MADCGPDKGVFLFGIKINFPQFVFKSSCKAHDFAYEIGGSEYDRLIADEDFFTDMRIDAFITSGRPNRLIQFIIYRYYIFWSILYYKAVRACGNQYFNYK